MGSYRSRVIQLYKNLLYLGRDYPKGYDYFRARLKAAFMKNKEVTEPAQLEVLLARGQYIIKELEALYMLKKYRTLKKRYYSEQ
ncbi:electron transfer flavoprotein regulatory factor 1-like [Tachypleus tridentatus]|uniref:electron transfer flavoprotein regulatory factor 1-like n=1 Tax=Tachypleus tridentatus TaxID=6853 RepID=UPI003FD317B0